MKTKHLWGTAAALALALAAPSLVLAAGRQQPDDRRFIVGFKSGKAEAGRAALKAAGAVELLTLAPQNAGAYHISDAALGRLQGNANFAYVEPDVTREPSTWSDTTDGSGETTPYGIHMVQADLVGGVDGARTVCIIDSGYSQQHVDLKDASTGDVTANTTDTGSGTWDQDSCGHGSHVAGTISAIAGNGTGVVGVYPGVKLHIVKVFGDDNLTGGNCVWTYSSTLVDALNKCVNAGANVVSMSLGGGRRSHTEDVAFTNAYNSGVLSIAAAGNAGNKTTSFPAGYGSVVSVAAVDANEVVASFSQTNRDVEIAAPGVSVLSTVPWLDIDTLTSGSTTVSGNHVEFSGRTDGLTAPIVDGAQCTATSPSYAGAVVLCQRGTISFFDKVMNVQASGGVAAAIYNNVASDPTCGDFLGTLGSGNSSVIPAISMSCDDGAAMLSQASGTLVSKLSVPDSGYEAWSGTSMATPHVSGVAALVWSHCTGSSAAQVRAALDATAKDEGKAGKDTSYGYGIVQAKAALDYMVNNGTCQ